MTARRLIAITLGLLAAGNGAVMLIAGRRWFEATPGVAETGPFNPHFVADVGAAYLVAGLALALRGVRPALWPAAVAGAAFYAAHALIHVGGIIAGHAAHAGFDLALVIAPAALSLWAAFPGKGEIHA